LYETFPILRRTKRDMIINIQGVPGGKVNILGGLGWVIRVMHLGLVDRPFVAQIGIVPSFTSRGTPHHAARETSISEGRKLKIRILPAARNEPQLLGSFTWPKVGTWGRLFDFPSEGREDFYIRKFRRFRPGLNPRTREPEASMLTTRPPTPLWEVILSVILSKKIYMNMYPIPNGFRDRAVWLYSGSAWAPSTVLPSRPAR
jgi:hypothetical protein